MLTKTMIVIAATGIALVRAGAHAQLSPATDAVGSLSGGAAGAADVGVAQQRSNAQIGLEVQAQLVEQLQITGITSHARDGVVTLHGTVRNQAEKDRAEQIARHTDGITRVENDLIVNAGAATPTPPPTTDNTLEAAVRSNLSANAQLEGRDITVQTRGNIVTLTGQVSSVADKELAGRLAADTREVAEVRNRLSVRGE